jgi:uncharacterized protein (DUF885 family)
MILRAANRAILLLLLTLAASFAGSAADPSTQPTDERLQRIFEDYFEKMLELHPELATRIGDRRYDDRLTLDLAEEHRRRVRALAERSRGALREIDPERLPERQRVHHEALVWQLERTLAGLEFPEHLLPLAPGWGMPGSFEHLGSGLGSHPFEELGDYDNFISRTLDFERWVELAIDNLGQGLERRITHPRVLVEKVLAEIAPLTRAAKLEDTVFLRPLEHLPATASESEREELRRRWRKAIEGRVLPAYRELAAYLEREYLPGCRVELGLAHLPRGDAWYAERLRFFTSTAMKPREIFAVGRREVERIGEEMDRMAAEAGARGRTDWQRLLQEDPAQWVGGEDRILTAYEAIRQRIEVRLPELFERAPTSALEIRPVEPHRRGAAPGAYYERPSRDGARPGVFYFTPRGGFAFRPTMEVLFLHEAIPGHHFQIALAGESEELPDFLRFGYSGAFIEGWGLYAESLGEDLGLYRDPESAFGRLIYELGRAGRLLGDVGIHHKGWSRGEASRYLTRRELGWAASELERYAALPGQAVAYKIGELELQRLRRRAEETLGPRFDPRTFHRLVLEDGALPLAVLEAKIERWLASGGAVGDTR